MIRAIAPIVLLTAVVAFGGEYRGKFTPDAEYVLSGKLARDLPPLPKVPFHFVKDGFAADRISKVPPVGVHPRVVLSPEDIDAIKQKIALGPKAGEVFRVILRDLHNKAAQKDPYRHDYGGAPWAGIDPVACKAILALLTDDVKLGREAVDWTMKHARFLEPRIDILNTHPEAAAWKPNFYYWSRTGVKVGGVDYRQAYEEGGAKRIAELAKKGVTFFGEDNQYAYTSLGAEYDYAHKFMTDAERAYVRKIIHKSTRGKYTTGMEIPGHFFINNHMSMGAEFLTLILAIEGEEGYDPRVLEVYAPRLVDKMTYDISPDGILYENVKGFIPLHPIYAAGRRGDRTHLRHSHLLAMMTAKFANTQCVYNRYIKRGRGRPGHRPEELAKLPEEPRYWTVGTGSGPGGDASFAWSWVLKHLYPKDPVVDYGYRLGLDTQNYDLFDGSADEVNYGGKIHYNVRSATDIMLLTAADGDREYQKTGVPAELQKRAKSWSDLRRGLAVARASWDKDALFVHYECRSDFFYAGHETPEHGDFTLSAHGVLWSPYSGPYMDCYFRNMVLIDGRAGVYQPVAGRMVGVYDSPAAAIFVSDATDGYNWRKLEKLFELDHEMLRSAWIFAEWEKDNAFKLDRHTEMPFHPHMREFYEGFAHLDWGPWHGETRGPERYQRWNDVRRVYRTLHVARGKAPYVLIVDDVQKDDQPHQYDWCFNLTGDAVLYKAASKARNRHLTNDTEGAIGTDLILCLANTPNRQSQSSGLASHRVSVKPQPKTGDPMLLVRVLWRNTTFPYPLPSFEETWGWKRVKVPAMAVEPEFRVMLFPHRFGDKLPMTKWSDDRTQLTVKFDGQTDVYTFGKTEDERTVFAMERDGKPAARIDSKPPKPVLRQARGAELVYKGPWDDVAPVAPAEYGKVCLLTDDVTLAFEPSPRGCEIRYTLDGTEPTRASTLYKGQFEIENSAKIRAKTYHRRWLFGGDGASDTLSVDYEKVEPLTPATLPEAPDEDMDVRVYEIKTSIYDERGFFTGTKKMLPDLDRHKPIFRGGASDFSGHIVHPEAPAREMKKAFTRYRGYFEAGSHGVYGFDVESCGPVLLTVGGRKVIEATGQYGLSWKSRIGQVALAKGWHRFELVVTDPVFWKGGMEPRRRVNVRHWCPERFGYVPTSTVVRGDVPEWAPEAPWMLLAKGGPEKDTAPGLIENRFDWTGSAPADGRVPANGLPRDYFRDIEAAKPYARGAALVLGGNDTLARVIEYRGFFRAVTFGDYSFRLDAKGGNQLVIDAHVVAQNRMQGGRPSGRIILDPGLYPISLRIAKGKGTLEMKGPLDGDFQPVSMADLLRPKDFKPVAGSTAPVAHVTFDAKEKVSILNASVVDGGRKGKGVELKATNAKVVLDGVKMLDDACTVALWLKRERVTDGILLDAPNKLSIRLRNRIIWASYYRSPDIAMANAGNAIDVGKWFHLAVTWGDEVRVYLDGKLLGSAQVDRSAFHTPGTDARAEKFVFFTDTWDRGLVPGIADEMRVYNRVLPLAEIQAIAGEGGR